MTYLEKLDLWVAEQKLAGTLVDFNIFPGDGPNSSPERTAKAVYETLTGVRKGKPLDVSKL